MCKLAFARLWLSDRHHPLSGTTMDIFGAIGKAFNVTAKYTHKFDTGKFFHASYVHGAVHQDSPIAGWLQQRWHCILDREPPDVPMPALCDGKDDVSARGTSSRCSNGFVPGTRPGTRPRESHHRTWVRGQPAAPPPPRSTKPLQAARRPAAPGQHAHASVKHKQASASPSKRRGKASHTKPRCRYKDPTAKDLPPIEDFDPSLPFSVFGGDFRRFDWRSMRANIETDMFPEDPLRVREKALACTTTPLGKRLRMLLELRGHQPFMRGNYRLDAFLTEVAKEPNEEFTADIWILVSRGFQVHAEGFEHPPQHGDNYNSCSDNQEAFETEFQRYIDNGFVKKYADVIKKAGRPNEKPVVTLSMGMVTKEIDVFDESKPAAGEVDVRTSMSEALREFVIKHRIFVDASSNATHGHDRFRNSLNDLAEKQQCQMAGIEFTLSAASRHGLLFVVDESDCYLHIQMAAHSLKHVTVLFKGVRFCFTSLCFGLRNAPYAAQSVTDFLCRVARRFLMASGLRCAPVAGSDQTKCLNRPENDSAQMLARAKRDENTRLLQAARTGHAVKPSSFAKLKRRAKKLKRDEQVATLARDSCDALHGFLDDLAGLARTPRAAWQVFLTLLWCARLLGIPINVKAHKSRSPDYIQALLGFIVDLKAFQLRLTAARVASLLRQLHELIATAKVLVTDLMTLVGVLVWASAVIKARPYYRQLLDVLTKHGYCAFGRYRRPARGKVILLDAHELRSAKAWSVCLQHLNGSSIARGIRRHYCPYELVSDACCRPVGSGWGFTFAGISDFGLFPAKWAPFIDCADEANREIYVGFCEGVAILYGLRRALPTVACTGKVIRIKVDNKGLVYQLKKLSSRDPLMIPILREVFWLCQCYGVELQIDFVPTKLNSFCDKLSRCLLAEFSRQDRHLLDEHLAEAAAVRKVATARGLLEDAAPARPDLLPLLKAERAQMLEPDAAWVPQRHALIDVLLDEWLLR